MIGFANPLAPPVEVWAVEGEDGRRELRGRVTFGYQYEGPPTCVHGGVIAELFDELLGMSNILIGQGAMTGTLKIRYRRPTPLLAPLELVARNTGQEGRKIFAWGGIYYQGELTAEADGIFIHVPPEPHARHRERQRQGIRGAAGRRRLAAHDVRGDRSGAGHALILSAGGWGAGRTKGRVPHARRAGPRLWKHQLRCSRANWESSRRRRGRVRSVVPSGPVVRPLAHFGPNGSIGSKRVGI